MSSFLVLCEGNTRNRWRDGQVGPDVRQGTMAPWARRLRGQWSSEEKDEKSPEGKKEREDKKSRERTDGRRTEKRREEKTGETDGEKGRSPGLE
ncbi:hypothetical protein TNCV_4963541 [Trichonephila clavipes]|nr:hypothetical protein TNCV_4963541 [Trichonephila clavipes]